MLALWMARLGISTRIIDKRNENDFYGQADGINGRSMEIFDSFDFMDRFMKESSAVQELCWWVCEESNKAGLLRPQDLNADAATMRSNRTTTEKAVSLEQCAVQLANFERMTFHQPTRAIP